MPKLFTVEVQYGTKANEPDWSVHIPAWVEGAPSSWSAEHVAERAARNHAAVAQFPEGEQFRVVVWNGKTGGLHEVVSASGAVEVFKQDPAAEFYSDMLNEEK
jgi:hypothetical protein